MKGIYKNLIYVPLLRLLYFSEDP